MTEKSDPVQPGESIRERPAFPPTPREGYRLLGVAYLTTAAIYLAAVLDSSERQIASLAVLAALFALFALSIYVLPMVYAHYWGRVGVVLFQIALVSTAIVTNPDRGYLPILCFIIIPIAYISLTFWHASALTLVCFGALLLAYWIASDLGAALALLLPYGGGFVFFAVIGTALVQQQKDRQHAERLLAELEAAHRQLRAYAVQVESLAVAEERNRLAREIHDSLGHYLTAITMHLEAAGKLVVTQPERAAEFIAKAEGTARESLAEVRRSVAALRASPLDTATLSGAIGALVDEFHTSGIVATFSVRGEEQALPTQVKTSLYRAAQEGLTNVRKHAHASAVDLKLAFQARQVTLSIADNGVGQHTEESEGFGLMGLRERVTLLGGRLEAGNDPRGGFRLAVTVPTQEQADE